MQKRKSDEQSELIALALLGIDAQIAELERKRAALVAQAGQPRATVAAPKAQAKAKAQAKVAAPAAKPRKRGKFSAAHRAKLKAAAQKRWAKVRAGEK